jgi:hypothetical protein
MGVQSAEGKTWGCYKSKLRIALAKRLIEESVVTLSAVLGSIIGAAGHLGGAG